jgi:hypothetical protein
VTRPSRFSIRWAVVSVIPQVAARGRVRAGVWLWVVGPVGRGAARATAAPRPGRKARKQARRGGAGGDRPMQAQPGCARMKADPGAGQVIGHPGWIRAGPPRVSTASFGTAPLCGIRASVFKVPYAHQPIPNRGCSPNAIRVLQVIAVLTQKVAPTGASRSACSRSAIPPSTFTPSRLSASIASSGVSPQPVTMPIYSSELILESEVWQVT